MNPFRSSGSRYARTPEPETPYQRAGQAWDARVGAAWSQARGWRAMAFATLALAAGEAAALTWMTARGTVTPWIVQVDPRGAVQAAAPADARARPTDPQVAWHLAQFIRDVRSLPSDPVVLRDNWLRAYAFARGRGTVALNDFARADNPFSRLGREQVSVEVSSVVRASPDSFRLEWVERRYADGQLAEVSRWSGILGVQVHTPRDAESLRRNPLGVFVTALDWSKELS
jgi:type IV secretion system protein VirB5